MIRFLRVRKLSEYKTAEVFSRKAVQRKTSVWQFQIFLTILSGGQCNDKMNKTPPLMMNYMLLSLFLELVREIRN